MKRIALLAFVAILLLSHNVEARRKPPTKTHKKAPSKRLSPSPKHRSPSLSPAPSPSVAYPDILTAINGLNLTVLLGLVSLAGPSITEAVTNGTTAVTFFAPTDEVRVRHAAATAVLL